MRFRLAPHVAWSRVGGELVVLDQLQSVVHGLDDRGGRIWEVVAKGSAEVADLVRALSPGDRTDRNLSAEIEGFCLEMVGLGLMARDGEATRSDVSQDSGARLRYVPPQVAWSEPLVAVGQRSSPPPNGSEQCLTFPFPPPPPPPGTWD
jgi:hypothetical protein